MGQTDEVFVTAEGYAVRVTTETTEDLGKDIHKFEIEVEGQSVLKKKRSGAVERTKQGKKVIKNEKSSLNEVLTWYHNQETGKMILVRSNVHSTFKHTGGNQLWGSGVH